MNFTNINIDTTVEHIGYTLHVFENTLFYPETPPRGCPKLVSLVFHVFPVRSEHVGYEGRRERSYEIAIRHTVSCPSLPEAYARYRRKPIGNGRKSSIEPSVCCWLSANLRGGGAEWKAGHDEIGFVRSIALRGATKRLSLSREKGTERGRQRRRGECMLSRNAVWSMIRPGVPRRGERA